MPRCYSIRIYLSDIRLSTIRKHINDIVNIGIKKMSHVTRMVGQEFNSPRTIRVQFVNVVSHSDYLSITQMGFSVDEDNMLLLWRATDEDLPAVIINVNNVKSIEILQEEQPWQETIQSKN